MNAIRTIQNVTGPTLTVNVPTELCGRQVEVVILPLDAPHPPLAAADSRFSKYIMPKPSLSEEDKHLLAQNPYPLRGAGGEYVDPFEPAVPPEDWEVFSNDPA